MKLIKKIFKSKILRLIFSVALIYFAFRKVDIKSLLNQLIGIKLWFVLVILIISLILNLLISYRWSLLLIKKPRFKDMLVFFKSSMMASFYGLILPSAAATDVVKWLLIDQKYPEIPKSKMLGSVFLDRIIGLSTYIFVGLIFILIAKSKGVLVPDMIFYTIIALVLGFIVFYIFIYFFDIKKAIFRFKIFKKFESMGELVNRENLPQIFKGMLVSLFSEFGWVLQLWFISWYFGANLSIFSILVYLPIISLILILPISIAGFGAREQLYLFFFLPIGGNAEGVLLTSAFSGILGILISLLGGFFTLTPEFKRTKLKQSLS